MNRKDLSEYRRKYHAFRHHAWAGLGFLSVVLAIRIIFYGTSEFLTPIIVVLAIYIIVALIFTYRYRAGLSTEGTVVKVEPSVEIEKERLKVEKKKAKSEAKKVKKANK